MSEPMKRKGPCPCDDCVRRRRSFIGAPEDSDAERNVLGGILLDNAMLPEIQSVLQPSDFHSVPRRVMYEAFLTLALRRHPIDYLSVAEELKANPEFGSQGPISALAEYESLVPSLASARQAAKRVKEMSIRRRLISAADEMIAAAFDRGRELPDLLQSCDRDLFAVSQGLQSDAELPSFNAMLVRQFEAMLERSRNPSEVTGLRTGFIDIDRNTGGLKGGQMIVIAGRPGHRKSLLAAHIARNAAEYGGKPVAVFSLEMRAEEMIDRYIAGESRVALGKVQSGRIGNDRDALNSGAGKLADVVDRANIYIFDKSPMTTPYMHARCRQIVARDKALGLVVLDYAQLLDGDVHDKGQNREREVARISRACKMLAMEMNVPVIILSQLNRDVEKRDNKRPMLSDLRESGALEQDADIVIGCYCADKYDVNSPDKGVMEAGMLKQRNGRTGVIGLALFAEEMRIADLDRSVLFGEAREEAARKTAPANTRVRSRGNSYTNQHD